MKNIKFKSVKIIIEKDGKDEEICIDVPQNHTVQMNSTWGIKKEYFYGNTKMKHTGQEFHKIIIFPKFLESSIDKLNDNEIEEILNR